MNKPIPQTQSQLRQRRRAGYQPPNPIRLAPAQSAGTAAREGTAPDVQAAPGGERCIDTLPLAMAYVPFQAWGTTYEPEKALARGTIFPALDLPFTRGGRS